MGNESRNERGYQSDLREARAAETRDRILRALIRVIHANRGTFSIPEVAAEAGVAVPTVYRHFPNKQALLDALMEEGDRHMRADELPRGPLTVDEFCDLLRDRWARYDAFPDEIKSLLQYPFAREFKRKERARRRAWFSEALRGPLSDLPKREREAARDVLAVLTASATAQTFQTYLGLDAEEAAERTTWAIKALLRAGPDPDRNS